MWSIHDRLHQAAAARAKPTLNHSACGHQPNRTRRTNNTVHVRRHSDQMVRRGRHSTVNAKPANTKPAKPANTKPAKPANTKPAKPANNNNPANNNITTHMALSNLLASACHAICLNRLYAILHVQPRQDTICPMARCRPIIML